MESQSHDVKSNFTVCKIEAGRAVLLSEDFELIEFPSNLLPFEAFSSASASTTATTCKTVKIKVEAVDAGAMDGKDLIDDKTKVNKTQTQKLIQEICDEFLVDGEEISRMKEEIGEENFLRVERIGCTAGIISWKRGMKEIIPAGKSVLIHAIDLFSLTTRQSKSLLTRRGSTENSCRIEFPLTAESGSGDFALELAINFRTSVGTFWTRPIQISRKVTLNSSDFSGIFLVTDLKADDDRLQEVREKGGYIFRKIDMKYPITAVVIDAQSETINSIMTDSNTEPTTNLDSNTINLLLEAKDLNLPIVSSTWLDSLLKNYELPLLS